MRCHLLKKRGMFFFKKVRPFWYQFRPCLAGNGPISEGYKDHSENKNLRITGVLACFSSPLYMTVLLCCYHVGHHVRQASSGTFHWRRHLIKRMTEARSIAAIRAIGPNRSCIIVRKKKLLNPSFCDQSMCQSMHFGKGAAVNNHQKETM